MMKKYNYGCGYAVKSKSKKTKPQFKVFVKNSRNEQEFCLTLEAAYNLRNSLNSELLRLERQ
jgi:hypothetical protein